MPLPTGTTVLREATFRVARATGTLNRMRDSEWRRRRLLILCYHGVSTHDEHEWNEWLYVPQEHLRERLRYLRENDYNILPLDEACRHLRDGTLPPRSVSVTFDDGMADFATMALPVLRAFDVPVTLYLTTYYAGVRLPVFDTMLSYVIWRGRESGGDVGPLCGSTQPLPVATPHQRRTALRRLYMYAADRRLDAHAKDALIADVASGLGVSYEALHASDVLQLMHPDTIASLPRELVDVQLHTHRHRTPDTRRLFARELRDNASCIRAFSGDQPLTHFCYPCGDYHDSMLPWLRDAGVEYATTCVPGLASSRDDPLLLPRFVDNVRQSTLTFEAWAAGLAEFVSAARVYHRGRRIAMACRREWRALTRTAAAESDEGFEELAPALSNVAAPSSSLAAHSSSVRLFHLNGTPLPSSQSALSSSAMAFSPDEDALGSSATAFPSTVPTFDERAVQPHHRPAPARRITTTTASPP